MITIPILKESGHLLILLGGKRAIVDTGSPFSMSPEPFDFLGVRHSPPSNIMGVTTRKMSELAGFQIDILIGCDILSFHTVRFRWRKNVMDVGDDIQHSSILAQMDTLNGIPVFPLTIQGEKTKAVFDTGAHLSYILPELVEGLSSSGERNDFYPFVGQFVTPTYSVPTALDDMVIDIEYGILPDSLQTMFEMTMNMSSSTAVIGTQLLDHFDCTVSWTQKKISWGSR